jgi:hypothetical protein
MKPVESREKIEEMRRRLYDRGSVDISPKRHSLTDQPVDVSRSWNNQDQPNEPALEPTADNVQVDQSGDAPINRKKRYRLIIFLSGLLLFLIVSTVAVGLFLFGGNEISGNNISLDINGPQLIAAGETVDLDFIVQNNNDVTIKSSTLIVKYPPGTRSVGDNPRNLFEERISLDNLSPGEVKKQHIQVAIFGEEGSRKEVRGTIEYRVDGSNGTFYKESDPMSFGISSSPLVLRVDSVDKVASGQEVTVNLEVQSNSSEILNNIVVEAFYPTGFRYVESNPEPGSGQNIWLIEELKPEETTMIAITGLVTGQTEDTLQVNFNAGPADTNNSFAVGASLADISTELVIERPFIEVDLAISGKSGQNITLNQGEISDVTIDILNTLDDTVYDLVIEVIPGGNALNENSIRSNTGFFDSNTDTVRWEVSNNPSFEVFPPGEQRRLEFEVVPNNNRATASYNLVVNVYASRVNEDNASELLVGTKSIEARYSSEVTAGSQVNLVSGPVPPKVGEVTTYNLTMVAEAGANDVTGAVVETSLPVYVTWKDSFTGEGNLEYNPTSKQIRWDAGNISANSRKSMNIEVDLQPSSSQVRDIPILLNTQRLQANDRYTSQLLQDSAPVVTTELSTELGFEEGNGRVER